MSIFDPVALHQSPAEALGPYTETTLAPSVLLQVARGSISVSDAFGVSNDATLTPARPDQTFEIGSQTKMMTAVVILQLVEEGIVDLDTPLSDYLDTNLVSGIANAETATIRQLLSHRSGIPDFEDVPGQSGAPAYLEMLLLNPTDPVGPETLLEVVAGAPAVFEPGSAFKHSNTNFLLLGEVVEAVTGNDFATELNTRVFEPAGMTRTKLDPFDRADGRLNSYTDIGDGALTDVTYVPLDFGATGGVVSNTNDMVRFLDALIVSESLLSPEMLNEMTTFLDVNGVPSSDGYGLGLASNTLNGQQFIGFQGGTLGTNSGTVLHVQSGTIISGATTHSSADPSALLLDAFHRVVADETWANFDPGAQVFEVSGHAADIILTELKSAGGLSQSELELDGARLTLTGPLGEGNSLYLMGCRQLVEEESFLF